MEETEKGKAIRLVKGTYVGRNGWINNSRVALKNSSMVCVIVDLEDGKEKATHVQKTSICPVHEEPQSFKEAALQQHKDLELALVKLAEKFARCGVLDNREALRLFNDELNNAREKQKVQKTDYHAVYYAGTAPMN